MTSWTCLLDYPHRYIFCLCCGCCTRLADTKVCWGGMGSPVRGRSLPSSGVSMMAQAIQECLSWERQSRWCSILPDLVPFCRLEVFFCSGVRETRELGVQLNPFQLLLDTGHMSLPPRHGRDFELLIDPSRSDTAIWEAGMAIFQAWIAYRSLFQSTCGRL